jgi:HPt (histidine-containing phosphotransfer) domain-containing protein
MGMTDEAPVLDPAVLDELRDSVGGDEEFIADLVATYVNEGSGHLSEMQAAAAARDAAAIVRPAHTLKSSSAALGAMRLSQIARDIEFAGREGDASGLTERVAAASSAWEETMAAMAAAGLTR